jgi:hypothetical protein
MFETISEIATWALCGGILASTVLLWLFVFARLGWSALQRRRSSG